MRNSFCLLATVIAVVNAPSQAADPILLGMLEQDGGCGREGNPAVRVLFAKDGDSWLSLASIEAAAPYGFTNIDWTIAFDGRALGEVRTADPGFHSEYPSAYSRDYHLTVMPDQHLPSIGNVHGEFGGWCDLPSGLPSVRPLVVNSLPSHQDPDQWKPFTVGDGYRELLFDQYMQSYGEDPLCHNRPDGHTFTADDLVLHKAYRDVVGRQLVALRLRPNDELHCDGPGNSPLIWFTIADTVQHIGNDLQLIDAGDYDNDGHSEIVFWYSGYNRDGYSMFFDGLSRRVDYIWSYH